VTAHQFQHRRLVGREMERVRHHDAVERRQLEEAGCGPHDDDGSQPEEEPADITENGIEARASAGLLEGVDSIAGAVAALLDRLGDDGYVAVMAYLDSERDASLHAVRASLSRRTGRPTTFGWGPRFLHSTGQYHKGGPPQGVYLQITSTESRDVEIPDRPFSFGTLIRAQAAGDARVLADHDRPVLRLHLLDPSTGVASLEGLLR